MKKEFYQRLIIDFPSWGLPWTPKDGRVSVESVRVKGGLLTFLKRELKLCCEPKCQTNGHQILGSYSREEK